MVIQAMALQTLLRPVLWRHWMHTCYRLLPVTAFLLPAAILFATIGTRLPLGYGRLALAALAIAVAVLIAELALILPWRPIADAAVDEAPDAVVDEARDANPAD